MFLLFVLLLLILPFLIKPNSMLTKEPDRLLLIKKLEQIQPDYIFIGNSMLRTRIDINHFNKITGSNCYKIQHNGVMSAFWYLIIKNVVSVSRINPKCVFILFRDTHLTQPTYRVDGEYKLLIDKYRSSDESVLDNIISRNKGTKDKLKTLISNHFYPFLSQHNRTNRKKISNIATRLTNFVSRGSPQKFTKFHVNNIFEIENFRPVATDGENVGDYKSNHNFEEMSDTSFLPHLIDIANKNSIKLTFVRVQRRPNSQAGPSQDLDLKQYINELKIYLENSGCGYYDFTDDPRITLELYGAGDHIIKEYKKKYTKIFVDTIITK